MFIDNLKYILEFEGDLLRAERKVPGSEYGELIEHHITNGTIVPVAITCSLLVRAMKVTFSTIKYIIQLQVFSIKYLSVK